MGERRCSEIHRIRLNRRYELLEDYQQNAIDYLAMCVDCKEIIKVWVRDYKLTCIKDENIDREVGKYDKIKQYFPNILSKCQKKKCNHEIQLPICFNLANHGDKKQIISFTCGKCNKKINVFLKKSENPPERTILVPSGGQN